MANNIEEKNNLLEVKNLHTAFYDGKTKLEAVRGIDFTIKKGEILGIVGESGSGKSVLVKSILGIIPSNAKVDAGEIVLDGKHIEGLSNKEKEQLEVEKLR